jgi:hypothetical protein
MNTKRPYTHILKNLFHEQATELIPLLLPGFQVERVIDVEMPELKSTLIESPTPEHDLEQGIVKLVMPEAQITGVYRTEWIEHSGKFERAYRVRNPEADLPTYMVVEFQTERTEPEDKELPRHFLSIYARVLRFADEDIKQDGPPVEEMEEDANKQKYYVYPEIICPFPHNAPVPFRETFAGRVIHEFNFLTIPLWEQDAREVLNTHVNASYFLLPVMKNADATLLKLAIEELAQRFQGDDKELGRHLSGMSLLLQQSEVMAEEEKLAALEYLKRYAQLITTDPHDE